MQRLTGGACKKSAELSDSIILKTYSVLIIDYVGTNLTTLLKYSATAGEKIITLYHDGEPLQLPF